MSDFSGVAAYSFIPAANTEQRRWVWQKAEAEGLIRPVFWDAPRATYYDWLNLVDGERVQLGLCFEGEENIDNLVGAFWVQPMGLCGITHFIMYRKWHGDQINIGKAAARWILDNWDYEALAAFFPASYHHVQRFIEGLGFRVWTDKLPLACFMPRVNGNAAFRDMSVATLLKSDFEKKSEQTPENKEAA